MSLRVILGYSCVTLIVTRKIYTLGGYCMIYNKINTVTKLF